MMIRRERRTDGLACEENQILSRTLHTQQRNHLLFRDFCRVFRNELNDRALAAIAATVLDGYETQAYAETVVETGQQELRNAYQRLKRQRTRTFQRLRRTLSPTDDLFERSELT
jgi:hypothetical protein